MVTRMDDVGYTQCWHKLSLEQSCFAFWTVEIKITLKFIVLKFVSDRKPAKDAFYK